MPDKLPEFSGPLLKWYRDNKRDLPWRANKDPYRVWLSEIILQQTRIAQGLPYYLKFIEAFPDVHALAEAPLDSVLKLWQGLGYYSRARNLHQAAIHVSKELEGEFPKTFSELIKLKGVGAYTASAIASICFDEPKAVVDGNVYRVLSRVFGIDAPINETAGKKVFSQLAEELIDSREPGEYNQAIMEFGALHCKPAIPLCDGCFFEDRCEARKMDRVEVLPVKLRKTRIKVRHFNYLVVIDREDRTLLKQRLEKDIWHCLYDFPLVESKKLMTKRKLLASQDYVNITVDLQVNSVFRYNEEPLVHKLSHQHLHLSFWIIEAGQTNGSAVRIEDIDKYPVPVPIQNFISEFQPFQ